MNTLSVTIEGTLGRLAPQTRAVVLILFSTLCFTAMHAVIRYASTEGQVHPFEVAFFRNFFGLLAVLPFALRGRAAALRTKRLKLHAVRGCMQVFAMLMFFYALSITPLAKVSAVSFTAPLFATLGAVVFLGERVPGPAHDRLGAGFRGRHDHRPSRGHRNGSGRRAGHDLLGHLGLRHSDHQDPVAD